MVNKILIIIWYILNPKFYTHFCNIVIRKFLKNHDTPTKREMATRWARSKSVTYVDALKKMGLNGDKIELDNETIENSKKLQKKTLTKMGGPAHINLLYSCVKLLKPKIVIETGVAYGWSSLAILKALTELKNGKLFSIDMPYPRSNNDNDVGIVVPSNLKHNWSLIRKPDNPGIIYILNIIKKKIDLCHYDSDKSWWGRKYAYPILWDSLNSGGIFISDDIQDNLYFHDFVKNKSLEFAIVEFEGKFVGLIRKP